MDELLLIMFLMFRVSEFFKCFLAKQVKCHGVSLGRILSSHVLNP